MEANIASDFNYQGDIISQLLQHQYAVYLGGTLLGLLLFATLCRGKKPNSNKNSIIVGDQEKKKQIRDNCLLICGPTNSGKTALFYHLTTKEVRQTVSSTQVNESKGKIEIKIPGSALVSGAELISKSLPLVDVPGHYHFKDRLNQVISGAKGIIVVIDSKDKDKFGQAAEILYDILNNIQVLSEQVPILVLFNKQNLQFAKKATILEIEMEKEIEELRKVRKATANDTTKVLYLETLKKKKFAFTDIKKTSQKFQKFINSTF